MWWTHTHHFFGCAVSKAFLFRKRCRATITVCAAITKQLSAIYHETSILGNCIQLRWSAIDVLCDAYTWSSAVLVWIVVLRTMVWKFFFEVMWKCQFFVVFVCCPLYLSTTVGNGYFKHHSENSSPRLRPITPECDLQAGCICG